jgi:hypothetical protein
MEQANELMLTITLFGLQKAFDKFAKRHNAVKTSYAGVRY